MESSVYWAVLPLAAIIDFVPPSEFPPLLISNSLHEKRPFAKTQQKVIYAHQINTSDLFVEF